MIFNQTTQVFIDSVLRPWISHAEYTMGSWTQDDTSGMSWWIGGKYDSIDLKWKWNDGSEMPTSFNGLQGNWFSSVYNPQEQHYGRRDCVSMSNMARWQNSDMFGKWFSSNCDIRKHYICQYQGHHEHNIFTGLRSN